MRLFVLLASSVLCLPAVALAAPITYTINNVFPQINGPGGYILGFSVTGTITTDGTLGTLASSDITGWSLLLVTGYPGIQIVSQLVPVNSTESISGSDVTATSMGLFYNYVAGTGFDALTFTGDPVPFPVSANGDLCYGDCGEMQPVFVGEFINIPSNKYSLGATAEAAQVGNIQIGSTPGIAATPEPDSLVLLGTGLVGIMAAARRRISR